MRESILSVLRDVRFSFCSSFPAGESVLIAEEFFFMI